MKIGKPIRELPRPRTGAGAIAEWVEAGLALEDGEWLPIEFDTPRGAVSFQAGRNAAAKAYGLVIKIRNGVAYVGKKGDA